MRIWWQGMVMVFLGMQVVILRAGALTREADATGAEGGMILDEGTGARAGALAEAGATKELEPTRTTFSTGAPDWTGRAGAAVGVEEVYFSLTITSSWLSSYLAPG